LVEDDCVVADCPSTTVPSKLHAATVNLHRQIILFDNGTLDAIALRFLISASGYSTSASSSSKVVANCQDFIFKRIIFSEHGL